MILTENWVRNKLKYWCILNLSINVIGSTALITLLQETEFEYIGIPTLILVSFVLFLVLTDFLKLAGLSGRNICILTYWQVVFIVFIGLISIGAIILTVVAITGLIHEVNMKESDLKLD